MTSANYMDGIGTGYTSHDKEICKRLKNNFRINQSDQTCTDAMMKHMLGWVKKQWFFPPPKTSYKLGTEEKQGKQVGFCNKESSDANIYNFGNHL